MNDTVPMPPKAKDLILSLRRDELRKSREIRALIPATLLLQLAFWWLLPLPENYVARFPSLTPSSFFWTRVVLSILTPCTLAFFIAWLIIRRKPAKYARDARSGRLQVITGQYTRGSWCGKYCPEGVQFITVEGVRLEVPLYLWTTLPMQGTMEVEYFPRSRLCWRVNGQRVHWEGR
jgi:hypothetical protein